MHLYPMYMCITEYKHVQCIHVYSELIATRASFNSSLSLHQPHTQFMTVTPVQLFSVTKVPEPLQEVSTEAIMAAKRISCSRPNFSANLVRQVFTIEERKCSIVKGKAGKIQLDPRCMQCVHDISFDEAGRRLHRSKIGKENQ